jgi:DNA-binding transcriptional LysR family regulator
MVLCEELHFSRTATRLRMAQSAVSYAIKSLEEKLGTPLFARSKRRVSLTLAGERFREHTQPAIKALEHAVDATRRVGKGQAGRLVLRFTFMSALTVVPRAVVRFQRDYPDVEIDLGPGGSVQQLEAIHAGRCDVGIMPIKRDIEPLATEVIQRSALVAILPAGHPLAKKKQVRLAELKSQRFVFLKLDSEPQTRGFFLRNCLEAGFQPNIILEIEQLEVLLAMVAAGLGISCTPGFVQSLQFPGVVMRPLLPVIHGGFNAVWDPRSLSPVAANFLTALRTERALLQREPQTRPTKPTRKRASATRRA